MWFPNTLIAVSAALVGIKVCDLFGNGFFIGLLIVLFIPSILFVIRKFMTFRFPSISLCETMFFPQTHPLKSMCL